MTYVIILAEPIPAVKKGDLLTWFLLTRYPINKLLIIYLPFLTLKSNNCIIILKLYSLTRLSIKQVIIIIWYDGMTWKTSEICERTKLGMHLQEREKSSEELHHIRETVWTSEMYSLIEWQWFCFLFLLHMQSTALNYFCCIICHCCHPLMIPLHFTPFHLEYYHSLTCLPKLHFHTSPVSSVPRSSN